MVLLLTKSQKGLDKLLEKLHAKDKYSNEDINKIKSNNIFHIPNILWLLGTNSIDEKVDKCKKSNLIFIYFFIPN